MRKIYLFLVIMGLFSNSLNAQELSTEFFDKFDSFLGQYHRESGLVDYVNIQKDNSRLDSLYKILGNANLKDRDEDYQKAFYINAYNIIVIKQVGVFYPIKSPFDVNGFFDNIKNPVAGNSLTLDELEKKVITSKFKDPRIHFALVCAAKGCPSLSRLSFRPESIEEELERITKEVCNNPRFVNVEGDNVRLSKIFDWYEMEFANNGTLIDFINRYRDEPLSADLEIVFRYYDWTLNDESLARG